MLKRNGCVYTQVVKNCSTNELLPILTDFADIENSTIYSDTWKAYDGLVDYGVKAHYRVKHSKNEFANGRNHINGIENFWGYAKHRLAKFRGISKNNFILHLKETEFRYNTKIQNQNLYKKLLFLIRENPLKVDWSLKFIYFDFASIIVFMFSLRFLCYNGNLYHCKIIFSSPKDVLC